MRASDRLSFELVEADVRLLLKDVEVVIVRRVRVWENGADVEEPSAQQSWPALNNRLGPWRRVLVFGLDVDDEVVAKEYQCAVVLPVPSPCECPRTPCRIVIHS